MITVNGKECVVEKNGNGKNVCYSLVSFDDGQTMANINIPGATNEAGNIIAVEKHMFKLLEKKGVSRSLLGFKRIGDMPVHVVLIDPNKILHI